MKHNRKDIFLNNLVQETYSNQHTATKICFYRKKNQSNGYIK